jgi:hypothetical protein
VFAISKISTKFFSCEVLTGCSSFKSEVLANGNPKRKLFDGTASGSCMGIDNCSREGWRAGGVVVEYKTICKERFTEFRET